MQPLRNLPIAEPQRPVVETKTKPGSHGNPLLWVMIGLGVVSIIGAVGRLLSFF